MKGRGIGTARGRATIMRGAFPPSSLPPSSCPYCPLLSSLACHLDVTVELTVNFLFANASFFPAALLLGRSHQPTVSFTPTHNQRSPSQHLC